MRRRSAIEKTLVMTVKVSKFFSLKQSCLCHGDGDNT